MLDFISKKRYIKIGNNKLLLHLSNPHESNYYNSIKNDDYFISKNLIKKGDKVLDLGANIGFTALLYLSFGAEKVFAFEPVSKLYKRIRSIKTDKIKAFNLALSNFEGKSEMFLSSSHNQGHSLNQAWPTRFTEVFKKNLSEIVTVSTLDQILPNEVFNFIKIDVEGTEKETIMGGMQFFKNNYNAIVQIEIYDWQFEDTNSLLSEFFSHTYVPIIKNNKIVDLVVINSFQDVERIRFNSAPNYLYSNKEITIDYNYD